MTAFSSYKFKSSQWQTVVLFTLGFWLSSSLIVDLAIMPSLYFTGMMSESGFATAGYAIFWVFNRVELLCAALVMTGILAQQTIGDRLSKSSDRSIFLSLLLFAIALIYTYILSPEMSSLGMNLNLFASAAAIPVPMMPMHAVYWLLEGLKLISGTTLLVWCYNQHN